jgi:hypothetical protein
MISRAISQRKRQTGSRLPQSWASLEFGVCYGDNVGEFSGILNAMKHKEL